MASAATAVPASTYVALWSAESVESTSAVSPALGGGNSTATGTGLSVVLLLPISPLALAPQHQAPPSFSAQL
jgi:hypothetical protein